MAFAIRLTSDVGGDESAGAMAIVVFNKDNSSLIVPVNWKRTKQGLQQVPLCPLKSFEKIKPTQKRATRAVCRRGS